MQGRTHLRRDLGEEEQLDEYLFDVHVAFGGALDGVARQRRMCFDHLAEFLRFHLSVGLEVALVSDDNDGNELSAASPGASLARRRRRRRLTELRFVDLIPQTNRFLETLAAVDRIYDNKEIA